MNQRIDKSSFIYSYLPFSDDRVQFLDIRGWNGQAIKLNRDFYIDLIMKKMRLDTKFTQEKNNDIIEELRWRTEDVEGVYILLGEDTENVKDGIVYIGETSDFKRRMLQYFGGKPRDNDQVEDDFLTNKDFCSEIFFFSQKGKLGGAGVSESLRKAIEARIIQEAKNIARFRILNSKQTYSGKLNLSEKDALEEFLISIKIILQHLGISLFKEKIMIKTEDTRNYFICTLRGADATMYRGEIGYVVLKNSIIVKNYTSTFPKQYKKIFEKRIQLIEEKILVEHESNENFILLEDQEFPSASGAADFVTGGHYNGYDAWKKKDNPEISLGQFLQTETESHD